MNTEHIVKAMANRRRLAILKFLAYKKEATVDTIAKAIKLSFKATSKHLLLMRHAEILRRRQENLNMFYSLTKPMHPITHAIFNDL